jgi:SAM-dependent methyltransferase
MNKSAFQQALNLTQKYLDSTLDTSLTYLKPVPKSGLKPVNFVSGEVDFVDFQEILSTATINDQDVFVDLGSGYGHCIAAAALYRDVRLNIKNIPIQFFNVLGIELMQSKVFESRELIKNIIEIFSENLPKIEIIQENFLNVDWSNADVVYACATCFTADLMYEILKKIMLLKNGSRIIFIDKNLELLSFEELIENKDSSNNILMFIKKKLEFVCNLKCKTSWGVGEAFIYKIIF